MQQDSVPLGWLQGLDLSANFPDERHLATSQDRLPLMDFSKTSNNRVCEWMPGCYKRASLFSSCGIPVICYCVHYPPFVGQVADQVTECSHHDIFVLIGQASSKMDIIDFRRDEMRIAPRYSILVTPVLIQDRDGANEFREWQKMVDSAALGGCSSIALLDLYQRFQRCMDDGLPDANDLGVERRLLTSRPTHRGGRNRVYQFTESRIK